MALYYDSLHYKNIKRYPYVHKVSIGEEGGMEFVYQYIKNNFSYQCDSNRKTFYTTMNVNGPPMKFSNYYNFVQSFTTGKVRVLASLLLSCRN